MSLNESLYQTVSNSMSDWNVYEPRDEDRRTVVVAEGVLGELRVSDRPIREGFDLVYSVQVGEDTGWDIDYVSEQKLERLQDMLHSDTYITGEGVSAVQDELEEESYSFVMEQTIDSLPAVEERINHIHYVEKDIAGRLFPLNLRMEQEKTQDSY